MPARLRPHVENSRDHWNVVNAHGVPVTKPFHTRTEAERFANAVGKFGSVEVPVLWITDLGVITGIPLYGLGTREAWFGMKKLARIAPPSLQDDRP